MKRLSAVFVWILPLMLAIVIGCGGSGGRALTGTSPDALTRQQVRSGLGRSIMALAQSGAFGGSVGTSSSSSGGGIMMGMPSIGGYVLSGGTGTTGGRDGGTTTGTSGGTGGSGETYFYYDEYLGLWAENTYSDLSYSTLLYEDEAKTSPAGSFRTVFSADYTTYTSTFEITAGNFAGAKGSYLTTSTSESGQSTWENTWPGWGSDKGSTEWSAEGGSWTSRNDGENGTWFESSGSYRVDGTGSFSGSDSLGYKYSFNYFADGSGKGKVDGPLNGLPCTIEWTPDGTTKITWADGTVEIIEPGGWVDGGTSGSSEPGTSSSTSG